VGTWIVREGDHCYNRLHWVYPNGDFGYYDKAHTFRVSGEADVIARGTKRVVFEYKGWRIKPAVCYDLRFPKWLRNDNMDYDLLLVCANWPASRREAWMTLLKARAIENLCYVVGCNRTGIDGNGGEYSGDSLAVNYKGLVFADGISETENEDAEMTIDLVLNKERLDAFRQKWPLYLDFD
jgi:predicted amidohydrolase